MTPPADAVLLFGRFHPLLVHLPIGLLVVLALLEALARWPRFQSANASAGPILMLAVPASIITAVCGWLLSLGGGYEDQLLQWHKWTGLAVAAMCAGIGLAYWLDLRKLYRLGLGATCALLLGTSHYGGSLTHGKGYLTRYAPAPVRALLGGAGEPPAAESPAAGAAGKWAFAEVIQPVLEKNCVACHGPEKAKAGLRLDTLPALRKGSEHGPVIVAGNGAGSELIKRLLLPATSDDHMPPEGKPQPAAADVALLTWWVDAGAPEAKKISELKVSPAIQQILDKRFGAARLRGDEVMTSRPPSRVPGAKG